jgi:GTP cyclohydrolase II
VLVYLRQEGRGIGLLNKIRAYALQEEGLDTIEANEALGFAADSRDYVAGADILRDLGADRVRLLSNNPEKFAALERLGIHVVERIPVLVQPNGHNVEYMRTKQSRMGHLYRVVGDEVALPARPRDLAAAIPA